jgi:hypothetical protein
VIQITDDPSAERTAPPRSTHVRSGDVSSFLIQQGGGEERLMEIQQHDGVVVEVAGSRQGFAKHQREGEVSRGEKGGARGLGVASLPPLHYL